MNCKDWKKYGRKDEALSDKRGDPLRAGLSRSGDRWDR
jgi:hypothetical protein